MQILYAKEWKIDDFPCGFGMLINLQKFESVRYQFHHIHSVDIHEVSTCEKQRKQFNFPKYNGESLPSRFHPQNLPNITSLGFQLLDNLKCISFSMNSEQIHSYNSADSSFLSLTRVEIQSCRNLSSLEQFLLPAYVPIIKNLTIFYCKSLELVPTVRFEDLCLLEVDQVTTPVCPVPEEAVSEKLWESRIQH